MQNYNYLNINLNAISSNIARIMHNGGAVMPMIKANGYGTNALSLAKFFQSAGLPIVGVAHVGEAVALREEGITIPLFVVSAPPFEANLVAEHDLQVAVSSYDELEALNAAGRFRKKVILIHIHIDTGMKRFGISSKELPNFREKIANLPFLRLEGIMTHLAAASSPDFDSFTEQQIQLFEQHITKFPEKPRWIHGANSAGALRFSLPQCNLVRPGLALFGMGEKSDCLTPSLSLYTHVNSIHTGEIGETIGYQRAYRIEKENMRIGILPFGYHDGFPRLLTKEGYVLIHHKKAPIVGYVCMDFMMVDLSEIPEARVGDRATLFDAELRPETVASWAMCDVREILCSLSARVKKVFAT